MSNVEEHIRRAMEEGRFDDLPGKGKPLRLDQNPNEDPESSLAYHILRNAGYTLPWIETRGEIETATEKARAGLQRTWAWRRQVLEGHVAGGESPALVEARWQSAQETFRKQIDLINQRIFSYNLEVPSEHFQLRPLNIERELGLIQQSGS